MKKIVFLVIGIALLLVLNFTSVPASASDDDETPDVPVWIEATYRITFINMTMMNISSTFAVHETCIDDINFTADDIRNASGGQVDSKIIKDITLMINETFNNIISTTFKNDTVDKSEPVTVDESTITGVASGGNKYQPPINFTKNATITFNVTSFGFEENPELRLDDVLRGTLKMGAVINKTFELKADAGYNNTFILIFSDDFKPTSMTDKDSLDTTVTWTVDNLNANSLEKQPLFAEGKLTMESRNKTYIQQLEEILTSVTIDMINFDNMHINGTVDIKNVSVKKYNISFPEEYIKNLSFVSSDGIRMALDNGLVEWEDIEREINNITKDAEQTLNSTFNTTIKLNFTWYNLEGYTLSKMSSDRPINATFIALNETNSTKIEPNIFGDFDAETVTGVLNAGAKYNFTVSASEENYTIKMILPENMNLTLKSKAEYEKEEEGRNAYFFDSKIGLSCILFSDIAPEYNESMALLNILIDMHDVNIFNMALNVDLNADAQIYRIELSDVGMPENLTIKYINSDCLRLLYYKGIIKSSDIDNITDEIKKSLEENLTNALGGNVSISVYIDYDSLKHYNVNNMSDVRPVNISAEAHINIPLQQKSSNKSSTLLMRTGNSVSCEQEMTLSFLTFPLEFPLSGMEGFNTTYKIILPKGINVIQYSDTLNRLESGTENGRTYLTVTLNETEEDTVSITIDATGLILNIILPFIILSVIMTVAGIVVKLMRRKEEKLE